nr:unnamed protein product [Digitaria exilis]
MLSSAGDLMWFSSSSTPLQRASGIQDTITHAPSGVELGDTKLRCSASADPSSSSLINALLVPRWPWPGGDENSLSFPGRRGDDDGIDLAAFLAVAARKMGAECFDVFGDARTVCSRAQQARSSARSGRLLTDHVPAPLLAIRLHCSARRLHGRGSGRLHPPVPRPRSRPHPIYRSLLGVQKQTVSQGQDSPPSPPCVSWKRFLSLSRLAVEAWLSIFFTDKIAPQIGSIFEYTNQRPVFGIIGSDSALYAPLLGFFVFTGIRPLHVTTSVPCLLYAAPGRW